MKITKNILRDMILQEMTVTLSPKDQINARIVQQRTGVFDQKIQVTWDDLNDLEDSLRMSEDIKREDLVSIKENGLGRIKEKLIFIDNMIDSKLKEMWIKLNNFKSVSESFGKINNFKVGDIVVWTYYDAKKTGIVSDLYFSTIGGRNIAYADIFSFEEQKTYKILCVNLKILTKNELEQEKN